MSYKRNQVLQSYFFCRLFFFSLNEFQHIFEYIEDILTILILEKLSRPSGVKSFVPSSMKDKSVRYMPKYGIQGGSILFNSSRIARNRPSEQTTDWSFEIVCLIYISRQNYKWIHWIPMNCMIEMLYMIHNNSKRKHLYISSQTDFGTLSHVLFKRKTAAFVNAAQTCRTPLKLCRQRQISATCVHLSIATTRACTLFLFVVVRESEKE